MAKLITRLIDRAFEVDQPTGGLAVPEPYPQTPEGIKAWEEDAQKANAGEQVERATIIVGGSPTTEVRIRVAVEGESNDGVQSWTPHLRRVIVRDVEERHLPEEFLSGGPQAAAAKSATPDAAADALCARYLQARGW